MACLIKNPTIFDDAILRSQVNEITEEIISQAGGAGSKFGTGGMLSKIQSAQIIFENNGQMVLMNGANPRDGALKCLRRSIDWNLVY